jgi:hypothetical protein
MQRALLFNNLILDPEAKNSFIIQPILHHDVLPIVQFELHLSSHFTALCIDTRIYNWHGRVVMRASIVSADSLRRKLISDIRIIWWKISY